MAVRLRWEKSKSEGSFTTHPSDLHLHRGWSGLHPVLLRADRVGGRRLGEPLPRQTLPPLRRARHRRRDRRNHRPQHTRTRGIYFKIIYQNPTLNLINHP